MAIQTSTLRPGLLVSLKTSISGGVKWDKEIIEPEHKDAEGKSVEEWQTRRIVAEPEEYENARKCRSKAASLVRAVCAQSAFGLLCPESDADKLTKAIEAARDIADGFNQQAILSRVTVYVITGRIAPDDVEAVKAINSEVKDLMSAMEDGIKRLDVKAVRDAASRAKEVGAMLSADAQARVQIAVEAAREVAKKIVKSGDQAAQEIDLSAVRKIAEMRTAFLDFDESGAIQAPAAEQRALDLTPASAVAAPKAATAPAIEV